MRWTTLESAAAGSFRTLTSSSSEGRAPFQSSCSPLRATDELAYVVAMRSFASSACEAVKMKMTRAKSEQVPAVFRSQRVRSGRSSHSLCAKRSSQHTRRPSSTLPAEQQHRAIAAPSHSHTMSETHTQLHSPVSPSTSPTANVVWFVSFAKTSSTARIVSFANPATPSDDMKAREPPRQRCIARAREGEGNALRPTEHTVHIGEDGRRVEPRQAGVRGPSEGVCPLATPALWYIDPDLPVAVCCTWADVRQEMTTEEVSELHYEHEECAKGKNGRCGHERAEDDQRHNVG
eukprot:scaffold50111_cov42-Phaeocystis_antarctica.AAC.2